MDLIFNSSNAAVIPSIVLIAQQKNRSAASELASLASLRAKRTMRPRMLGGLGAQDLRASCPVRHQLWAARSC